MLRTLSVVIPAYNEEERLPTTIERVVAYASRSSLAIKELIVVDDGSQDGTARVVRLAAANWGPTAIRLLQTPENRGKGHAVKTGMLAANGDWILCSDADLSAPIEEVEVLFAAALRQNVPVVIGSRAVDGAVIRVHQPFMREFSGRLFNRTVRLITGLRFRDTQCGFKLFRRDVARDVFSRQIQNGFCFDVETLVIAAIRGLQAIEVPVVWSNVEGTKVGLSQGLKAFVDLLRISRHAAAGRYNAGVSARDAESRQAPSTPLSNTTES